MRSVGLPGFPVAQMTGRSPHTVAGAAAAEILLFGSDPSAFPFDPLMLEHR